jgi:hypothetical protein
MKKIYIAILIGLIAMPAIGLRAQEKDQLIEPVRPSKLDIDVWVDNEDGVYYEGESITIFFHANRDCHVAIYGLDTRGDVNLLYPAGPWDNGFVYGGEVYAIPADFDDYELIVTGPEGIEHIQAIASQSEMEIPDWFEGSPLDAGYYDDSEDLLDHINNRYFKSRRENRYRAFDHTSIYVKTPRYYYKPVYVPNHWYDYPHYSMVYFDYPFGAEIYIDGIYFGIAPLWIPRVMIGWHWITIYDRYGYCWENHMHFQHNHTVRFDRSRVKTTRTVTSRYKDVRKQAKKYNRSSYVLSDTKVKTTRSTTKELSKKRKRSDLRDGKSTPVTKDKSYRSQKSRTGGKTTRIEDTWNSKRSSSRKSGKASGKSESSSKRSSGKYRKSGSDSKKSTEGYKSGGSRKSSGSSVKRGGGSSKKPSGSSVKRGGGSSRKSSGSSVKRSGGSLRKSSGKSSKSSGSSRKSSGSKKSSGKSSSSKGKGGGISKPSGGSQSSSIGRPSSGRSNPGKSSSSRSSSRGGGKRR